MSDTTERATADDEGSDRDTDRSYTPVRDSGSDASGGERIALTDPGEVRVSDDATGEIVTAEGP